MDKALIILSDNNKGKFISKGFLDAFKKLSYFVYEKKIFDLNCLEIEKINPDIIFIYWSDIKQKDILFDFILQVSVVNAKFIHCAELKSDIPIDFINRENHYVFSCDNLDENYSYSHCVNAKDYRSKFEGYKYSITFAGNPAREDRELILSELIKNFGEINLFCRSFDFYKSLDDMHKNKLLDDYFIELYKTSYRGYVESTKELSCIYSSSKINLDMSNDDKNKVNYRCLEIMASGGFLLTPHNSVVVKQFEDGCELETYASVYELIDKVSFYFKNLNLAQAIADKGKRQTLSNCSYYDKLKSMLKVIYGKNFSN